MIRRIFSAFEVATITAVLTFVFIHLVLALFRALHG
jgi:hypothetical protein